MKPKFETILRIAELKKQIDEAYAELDGLVEEIDQSIVAHNSNIDKRSEVTTRFDYELALELDNLANFKAIFFGHSLLQKGPYLKFEITDNVALLHQDGQVFKSTAIKPLSTSIRSLKRCPASLKS